MTTAETVKTIGVGQPAPDFELAEARGGRVRLSDVTKERPTVLVFYRGGWCPICNKQLGTLSQDYEKFRQRGAEVLAISNEEVEKGLELLKKIGPPFKLLHDPKSEVIRTYGTLVRQRDPLGIMHRKHDYAHPSVFIVDRGGIIRWAYVGKDYRDRPANDSILEALSSLPQNPGTR
jgi:peroxiredoxin